ncbi:MAG TPA: TlpA disulfide reductase family protein, partial [Chthonomonadales bacterium]|nr:TlpA disulfide reductase family protein [Chthonomonadales bacterium]
LLIALFKVGCGTCKYSFPYWRRYYAEYASRAAGRFQIWGVSQDSADATATFADEYGGAGYPLLLDEGLQASRAYRITHVPDLYLLDDGDKVVDAVVGHFSATGYNRISAAIADRLLLPYAPVVREEDGAPGLKPG